MAQVQASLSIPDDQWSNLMAADEKKEPSTPYGEPDKDMERDKKNTETGESSAPYGVEGETPSTNPAKKQPS